MKSYIVKPNSIKKSEILNKFCSLLPSEHRIVQVKNINQKPVSELVNSENVGEQINVKEYLNFDSNYYLGTISGMNSLIYDETKGEKISPFIFENSTKKLKKGAFIISRNASLGKISYLNKNTNAILNGGLSYLQLKENYKWYFFAFFIVNYGSEYLTCITSGGGTQQNAKRQNVLDLKIPFPITKNNSNPQDIEKLISLIIQNIIDKEEKIEIKNRQIDELIKKELKDNQKNNTFSYKLPKISDIKRELRLDTGLYERDFQKNKYLIENYKYGFNFLNKKEIFGGNTPKKRIFGKGNLWLTPTDCKKGVLTNKSLIKTQKYNLNEDSIVIVNRSNVAETVLFKKDIFKTGHHNQGMYRVKIGDNMEKYLFTLCWFNSVSFQKIIKNIATGATFPEIRVNDLSEKALIPNLPEQKQREISKLYYNEVQKNSTLNFKNYLEKEKDRNSKVGIFQLNMEIFSLKEILEDLIDRVIQEEKIEISFDY